MHKVAEHISAVLKGVLLAGISVQIVLGLIWMCRNFSFVPQFGESLFYTQVSRTLGCDEYTGILYPVFLRLVGRNHYVVYVLQLAAAAVSARRFLRGFLPGGGWKPVWGILALLTAPVAMQCHLAVLPCSFAASLLLAELSLLLGAVRSGQERTLSTLARLGLCWLGLGLLLPEYLFLGAVPVALFGVCCCRRGGNRRKKCYGLLLAAVFAGMILSVSSLTRIPGLYGRVRKTPLMTLTQRIAWTSLLKEYDSWIGEIEYFVDEGVVLRAAMYADGMEQYFFPVVEQAVADQVITRQQAGETYVTLAETAWERHKFTILKEMAWDLLGYGASPAFLQGFLAGRGYDTYSNRNYDFFLEHTPGLSLLYMDYGSWWFAVAVVLTAVLRVLQGPGGGTAERKTAVRTALCCLTTAGAMAVWYTMRGAGMLDYKNTILIVQLWTAWSVVRLEYQAAAPCLPEGCGEEDRD